MAGSLDDLIRFLLDEIALSGQQGATPADVLDFVSLFYKATGDDAISSENDPGQAQRFDSPTIDRAFQEQVWRWLTRHPDILIGKDKRGNCLSLSAAEAQSHTETAEVTPEAAKEISTSSATLDTNTQQHQVTPNGPGLPTAKKSHALRVYVTEERMWLAICGHVRDLSKVFDTEFALLSIIAAHRRGGILQGDLVKKSGQDKRSVPKRTDELRNKGYIEKRLVHLKGLKTSRLVLRKFASNVTNDLIVQTPELGGPQVSVQDDSIDFHALIRDLFTILKKKQIITRDDLKKELGMTTRWRARTLARVIRKLEAIGCLKRVKAASEASKEVRYYFNCIKLIHEPSDRDLEAFRRTSMSLVDEQAAEEPDMEEDDDDDDDASQAMAKQTAAGNGNQLEEVDRLVPQWHPDRILANALFDLLHDAGIQGCTNRELRQHLTGTFVRRPLEHLLTRLTALWLESQPLHLRHLAVVRDTTLSGTIPLYVHYSFPNFEARVASGLAFWEAVKASPTGSGKKEKKMSSANISSGSTGSELDQYGFPTDYTPDSQYKGGRATLGQSMSAAQPGDLPFSNRDPMLYRDDSGAYRVRCEAVERNSSSVIPVMQSASFRLSTSASPRPRITTQKPSQLRQPGTKPIGRPRKFLRGTEKFWQEQFAMASRLADPDKYSPVGSKAGVMTAPAGISLFAKRPSQFDPTLVRALESGLPIPAKPKDITQEWVDTMLPILDRSAPGVWITPKGVRLDRSSKHRRVSRVLVIRSSRLGELDLSEKRETPAVRFMASSAAHTFADLRNEYLGETVDDSEDDIFAPPPHRLQAQSPAGDLKSGTSRNRQALHDLASDRLSRIESDKISAVQGSETTVPSSGKARRVRRRKNTKTPFAKNASLSGSETRLRSQEASENLESPATPTRPSGLPSPFMTRSSLRQSIDSGQPTLATEKVQGAPVVAASTNNNSDLAGRTLESATLESRSTTSVRLNQVPLPVTLDQTKSRSKKQLTPVATVFEKSLSTISSIPGATPQVFDVSEQVPNHLVPESQTLTEPPRKSQTAPLNVTTRPEKPNILGIEYSRFSPINNDERDSEAFRLVQELTANEEVPPDRIEDTLVAYENQKTVSAIAYPEASGHANLPELRFSDIDSDKEPPRKRSRQEGVGAGSVAVLRRKIVMDLMEGCGGALPYYSNSLWIAFRSAWQKAGQSGKPDIKTLKTAVKSLCQNGSAKQIKFSHRNKRGFMVTKTILAKSDLAISDHVILKFQKKMIEADPQIFLPEELDVDSDLKRDLERQRDRPWPAVFEEQTVEPSAVPVTILRLQLRETLLRTRDAERVMGADVQNVDETLEAQNGNVGRRVRLGGIRRKYQTSSEPYQRPKLSKYYYPQPPQQPFSNQPAEPSNALRFRTELLQVPLTFKSLVPQAQLTLPSQALIFSSSTGSSSSVSGVSSKRTTPQPQVVQSTPIVWKNISDRPVLPSSVEEILLEDRRRKKPDYASATDPGYRKFEWDVDGVARWEQRSFKLFDFNATNWTFINHPVGDSFQEAPGSRPSIGFDGLIWYDKGGHEHTERRFHDLTHGRLSSLVGSRPPVLQGEPQNGAGRERTERAEAQDLRKRKRTPADLVDNARKRRRGKSPLTQPQTITDSAGNLIDVSHLIGARYKRPRGTQHLRTMPEHLIYKLTITVVVVRALAGGLEKHVDWPLVMCVFPDEDEEFLKGRWRTISNKHRRDVEQLLESFHDRFPEAYARGEVPRINFDEPQNIDWESIVSWALNHLDKPIVREVPDLPATRSELDETVIMKVQASHRPYRDMFGYNQAITVPMKEAAISAIPFAVPLPPSPPASPTNPPHLFDPNDAISDPASTQARSWVLSTITTPLHTFDAAKAHSKLQSIAPTAKESEAVVKSAMKSLTSSRAIARKRDTPVDAQGRTFDLSRIFTDTLDQRRTINAALLKQAQHYKTTVLDPAFTNNDSVRFHPVTTEDGDMIAILNLAANGRIKISMGDDVPRNRWGIDPQSRYKTRNIRKETLYFTVFIAHIPGKYIFGNPLLLRPDLPIPDLGTGVRDPLPIWRDIHGDFQRTFWDLAIAAVLGVLASRPGASVREITKMLNPTLGGWEVECLLGWCLRVGVVKETGLDDDSDGDGGWTGGWEVKEWWWMVLECGRVGDVL